MNPLADFMNQIAQRIFIGLGVLFIGIPLLVVGIRALIKEFQKPEEPEE